MSDREMTILMPVEIGTLAVGDRFHDGADWRAVEEIISTGIVTVDHPMAPAIPFDTFVGVERTITGPVVDAVERGLVKVDVEAWAHEPHVFSVDGQALSSADEPKVLYRIPEGEKS